MAGGANAVLTVVGKADMQQASKQIQQFGSDADRSMSTAATGAEKMGKATKAMDGDIAAASVQMGTMDKSTRKLGQGFVDVEQHVKNTGGALTKTGGSFKEFTGNAVKGVGAVAAAVGGFQVAVTGVKDAAADSRAIDTMNTAFANTGNFAGMSAAEIDKYSQSLEKNADALAMQTGVSGDSIMAANKMLATFPALTTEEARNAEMMERLTEASVNMSAAGFGSVESSAKALGKAMEDPVKGMSALYRVGITFTDQQQEQIKALAESGQAFEAQQIILGEVEKKFKGVAAASTSSTDKMKQSIAVLVESLGEILLPILQALGPPLKILLDLAIQVADVLGQVLKPIIDALTPIMEQLAGIIGQVLNKALELLMKILKALEPLLRALGSILKLVSPLLEAMGTVASMLLNPALQTMERLLNLLTPVIEAVARVIETIVGWLKQFYDWINKSAKAVKKFMQDLNPLSNFKMPSFGGKAVVEVAGGGGAATRTGASSFYVDRRTINVNTGVGDPVRIAREIKGILARDDQRRGRIGTGLGRR